MIIGNSIVYTYKMYSAGGDESFIFNIVCMLSHGQGQSIQSFHRSKPSSTCPNRNLKLIVPLNSKVTTLEAFLYVYLS